MKVEIVFDVSREGYISIASIGSELQPFTYTGPLMHGYKRYHIECYVEGEKVNEVKEAVLTPISPSDR